MGLKTLKLKAFRLSAVGVGAQAVTVLSLSLALAEPPVALVEDVLGGAARQVQPFDYLYSGQRVTLGDHGRIVLAYFSTCRVETVSGGTLTVGAGQSSVDGGTLDVKMSDCQGTSPVEIAAASEAGAGVIRVTPFSAEDWDEWTVKFDRPVFTWEKGFGTVSVAVRTADKPAGAALWTGQTDRRHVRYPDTAPTLTPGAPYQVIVTTQNGDHLQTVFSVDPWLDVDDTPLNRVVPLRPQVPPDASDDTPPSDAGQPTGTYQ